MNSIPVELRQAMYCKAIDIYKSEQVVIIQKYCRRWLIKKNFKDFIKDLWVDKYENACDNYIHESFEIEDMITDMTSYNSKNGGRIVEIETEHWRNNQQILLKFDSFGQLLNCVDLINDKIIYGYMLYFKNEDIEDLHHYENNSQLLIFDDIHKLQDFKNNLLKHHNLPDIELLDCREFFNKFTN